MPCRRCQKGPMGDKTLTADSAASIALLQVQVNALLLLLERQHPNAPIRQDFQRLMEGIKNRLPEDLTRSATNMAASTTCCDQLR